MSHNAVTHPNQTRASIGIYSLLLVVFFLPMGSSAQSVYKCTDKNGHVTFSNRACEENTKRETIDVPVGTGPTAEEAAAISARRIEAINAQINYYAGSREQRQTQETPTTDSTSSQYQHCGAVTILSYRPYDNTAFEGGSVDPTGNIIGGMINTHRCAMIDFRLNGHGGQFNDHEFANKIAGNFRAVLASGKERIGVSGYIKSDRRIQLGRDYTGSFCFGTSDYSIAEIRCK